MKGPHGKGTHPSDWGLGAAWATMTPRKTVLKRVEMRFIFKLEKAQGSRFWWERVKSLGGFYSRTLPRNGQKASVTAQADVGHGIN